MVLPDLQGKGLVRQRSISGDLIYSLLFVFLLVLIISLRSVLVTLYQDKVTAQAAIERYMICIIRPVQYRDCFVPRNDVKKLSPKQITAQIPVATVTADEYDNTFF